MKRGFVVACVILALAPKARADRPKPGDDRTFRPTVLIRKGTGQGSGTIIGSANGLTLVLTAAHVVAGPGELRVELHRFNLGVERRGIGGKWPRSVAADIVASDAPSDVALLRIRNMVALPFAAELRTDESALSPGTVVTSIGIDRGAKLFGWSTHVVEVEQFESTKLGLAGRFVITDRAPEHGHSGGGLFLANGTLVGVCVGRADLPKGRRVGIFASPSSIQKLLRAQELQTVAGPGARTRRPALTPTGAR